MHNETINIWSHLFGFALFSAYLGEILLNHKRHTESSSSPLAIVPIVIQLLSYMFCMLSSSLFHTFACHSEAAYNWYDAYVSFDDSEVKLPQITVQVTVGQNKIAI